MTPQIIDREEFIVVGIRAVLDPESDAACDFWKDLVARHGAEFTAGECRYYGVFDRLSEEKGGLYEYVGGMVAPSLEDIPVGMVGWIVPAGTYAEVEARGLAGGNEIRRAFIVDWLPDSGYQLAANPTFICTESPEPASPDAVWRVNIPVDTNEAVERMARWFSES